jgi:intein/homing endonuclease
VIQKWDKGKKKVLKIHLSSGTILECTPEHKLFIKKDEQIQEIKAKDLFEGDELYYKNTLKPLTYSDYDVDYLRLIGLFVADGWTTTEGKSKRIHRMYISGKDGFPKEIQKKWIAEWCEKNGIKYTLFKRYIHIRNKLLAQEAFKFGQHAKNKNLTKEYLQLESTQIYALLDGLSADASKYPEKDKGSIIYGTISRRLATQIRILYRLLGEQLYVKWWTKHGGLGKNPICRLHNRGSIKNLPVFVKKIEEGEEKQVYDIETGNKGIYLPEHDIIVHNCESESLAIISAITYYELKYGAFKDYSLFLGQGWFKFDGKASGHGFILVLHNTSTNLKDSYIIEATTEYASKPYSIDFMKDHYDTSWGLIGFVREDYKQGTYHVKDNCAWWKETGENVNEKESLMEKIKVKLHLEDSLDKQKHKKIQELWRE